MKWIINDTKNRIFHTDWRVNIIKMSILSKAIYRFKNRSLAKYQWYSLQNKKKQSWNSFGITKSAASPNISWIIKVKLDACNTYLKAYCKATVMNTAWWCCHKKFFLNLWYLKKAPRPHNGINILYLTNVPGPLDAYM